MATTNINVKLSVIASFTLITLLSGCTLPPWGCYLTFLNFNKVYEFAISKEALKDNILTSYSHGDKERLFFNGSVIEDVSLEMSNRPSAYLPINKLTWNNYKAEIRAAMKDTLYISISKTFRRKKISMMVIVSGDDKQSALMVKEFTYGRTKACNKSNRYYQKKLQRKIKNRFIKRLN